MLPRDVADHLRKRFQRDLEGNVRIIVFVKDRDCRYCGETAQIGRDVAELDPRISTEVYDAGQSSEMRSKFGIELVPATIILGDRDYRIRHYGIPSGGEFSTYVEDIISVSRRRPKLDSRSLEMLRSVDQKVHIQVFVTPTCPHCPRMVFMAHQFAIANENINADMIEATEFPELARKYRVLGVPKTIVNGTVTVVGQLPEDAFVEFILYSIGKIQNLSPTLEGALKASDMGSSIRDRYRDDPLQTGA